ncbi:MAG: ferritin [Desulfuromonas sp.]|nr:MAG: ferritin [Desulfuromonas sp.]
MNVYRCRICGDPNLGEEVPSRCPFCGAHPRYMLLAADYQPAGEVSLSRKTRDHLEKALELEIGNSCFYRGAAKVADSEDGRALFSALAKVEAEHAGIACKLLGRSKPDELFETGDCSPVHHENLEESHRRENRAVHLYRQFLEEAEEERVREVFEALIEIEADHMSFSA